ncbi:MAG: hypothetical protein ACRD1C_11220 [Terriglobales bacterium]
MKLGAEKKGEVIVLVVLLAVAALLLGRSLLAGFGGAAAPAPAAIAPAAGRPGVVSVTMSVRMDPRLHLVKLAVLRAHPYRGDGRNLFHFGAAPPPPPTAFQIASTQRALANERAAAARMAAQGPPPPPPVPLQFYGFAISAGLPERVFVQFGQDSYVVAQGDTIAHRYQIEQVGKASVRVRDLMTQSVQEVPLQRPASGG